MNADKSELRLAVSRLLTAVAALDLTPLDETTRRDLVDAREFAARTLVKVRALSGRPWAAAPGPSFYERWRALKAVRIGEGCAGEALSEEAGGSDPEAAPPAAAPAR